MNRTEIKWENKEAGFKLTYTWNPLYSCKRGCYYCYARKAHDKWREQYKRGKVQNYIQYSLPFDTLQVFDQRLYQPAAEAKPSVIFVCDMGDICFHTSENIIRVRNVVSECPHHIFLFLTQDYSFYKKYQPWPDNAWLGITMIFGSMRKNPGFKDFRDLRHNHKFISIEPLMGMFDTTDLSFAQWIIVGGMNHVKGEEYVKPQKHWVKSIKHRNIYYKDFICKTLAMQD